MIPPDCAAITGPHDSFPVRGLEKLLRVLSVFTLLMTVPQVLTIWVGRDAGGVALVSWVSYLFSACLWLSTGCKSTTRPSTSPASAGSCWTRPSWSASSSIGDSQQRFPTASRALPRADIADSDSACSAKYEIAQSIHRRSSRSCPFAHPFPFPCPCPHVLAPRVRQRAPSVQVRLDEADSRTFAMYASANKKFRAGYASARIVLDAGR